jgi:hypothetical protein
VAPVVGQKGEVVLAGGYTAQEVEVTDASSLRA